MTISLRGVGIVVGVLVAAALALWVWPTAWNYPQGGMVIGNQAVLVAGRVNRFTGKVEALTIDGWKAASPAPAVATPAAVAKPPIPSAGVTK